MAHRLGADSETRSGAQLFQAVDAESSSGGKQINVLAERRAKIDKLVRVVFDTGFAEHGAREHARGAGADGQSVRGCAIDLIGRLPAAASRHILANDRRISGNVFLQKLHDRLGSQVGDTSRTVSFDDGNGFPRVIRRLRAADAGEKNKPGKNQCEPTAQAFHLDLRGLFASSKRVETSGTDSV